MPLLKASGKFILTKKQHVNLMMQEKSKRDKYYEWACRILLTIHLLSAMTGYTTFLQTRSQLMTPLIPQSAVLDISRPAIYTGLCLAATFLISLWLYFLKQKLAVIIMCAISLIAYEVLFYYFVTNPT